MDYSKDLRRIHRMGESMHAIKSYRPNYLDALESGDLELLTMCTDAINMRIQDITENSIHVSDRFKSQYIDYIPWDDFRFARNTISHNYEGFDEEFVNGFVKNIDMLLDRIEEILEFHNYEGD